MRGIAVNLLRWLTEVYLHSFVTAFAYSGPEPLALPPAVSRGLRTRDSDDGTPTTDSETDRARYPSPCGLRPSHLPNIIRRSDHEPQTTALDTCATYAAPSLFSSMHTRTQCANS